MKFHPYFLQLVVWGYRLLHLAPIAAIAFLPVGKWPAVIIAALWPAWLIGLLLFETEVLRRKLGPVVSCREFRMRRDAEAGDAAAQDRLADYYYNGNQGFSSSEINVFEADRWYRQAADQGHSGAAFKLADILMTSEFGEYWGEDDMPPYPDDPIPRFRKQRMINGAICNRKAAAEYYRLAAKRGHARAQGRLGEM